MGGYAAPPPDDTPATKEEAEARAGAAVDFRGTYGGESGRAATNWAILQDWERRKQEQQEQPQTRQQQEQSAQRDRQRRGDDGYVGGTRADNGDTIGGHPSEEQMMRDRAAAGIGDNMAEFAVMSVEGRADFVDFTTLGDTNTRRIADEILQRGEAPTMEIATGIALNRQLESAKLTQGTRDVQFFLNEVARYNHNAIALSAEYHSLGMTSGVPVKANPFEYAGDLALALEKGGNPKDFTKKTYGFNPDVGRELGLLPGGKGLQETAWDVAKTGQPSQGSFEDAIRVVGAARGLYGPYGGLYGGKADERNAFDVLGKKAAESSAVFDTHQKSLGSFQGMNIVSIGAVQNQPANRGVLYQQNLISAVRNFAKGDVMGGLSNVNNALVQFTYLSPDVKGMGAAFEAKANEPGFGNIGRIKTPLATIFAGIGHASEVVYSNTRDRPLEALALYELPLAFKSGEVIVEGAVAAGATSKIPLIAGAGRALSSPLAIDAGRIAKAGMGAYFVGSAAKGYMEAPDTVEGKGKAAGEIAYSFGWVMAGVPQAGGFAPKSANNPFESRKFTWDAAKTGERVLPFTDKAMIRAGDAFNGLFQSKGQRLAIRDVSTEYGKTGFVKPEITDKSPNLADLTHVGKRNAPAVLAAMDEQPSVMYGSGTIRAQTNIKTPMGKILMEKAGISKDADFFTEDKMMAELTVKKFGGKQATAGIDVHTFPEGYPDVGQSANEVVQPGSYLFGNRYRTNPFSDEITMKKNPGDVSFEHLNVQNRKLSSAVRDDIADPMNKGYRLGKDLSRLTRTGDYLSETKHTRNPDFKPENSAFDHMLKQKVTYAEKNNPITGAPENIRTDTLFNIRARYESGGMPNIGEPIPSPQTKGIISGGASIAASGMPSIMRMPSPSPIRSQFRSSPASPLSSTPSSPISSINSPDFSKSPQMPQSPSSTPSRSLHSPLSQQPYSPSSRNPSSPPSSPGSPPSPPYSPATSHPPGSPPSKPPYSKSSPPPSPISQPPTPPAIPFSGDPLGGSGSGGGTYARERTWTFTNPVGADRFMGKRGKRGKQPKLPKFNVKIPKF